MKMRAINREREKMKVREGEREIEGGKMKERVGERERTFWFLDTTELINQPVHLICI